jgi:hypothetical protein
MREHQQLLLYVEVRINVAACLIGLAAIMKVLKYEIVLNCLTKVVLTAHAAASPVSDTTGTGG